MVARSVARNSAPSASRSSSLNSRRASGSTRSPSGGSSTPGTLLAARSRISAGARPFAVSRTQPSSHPWEAQLVAQVLHDVIHVEREGAVVTLTIDHPPANAVNGDVVNGLAEGLANAEADEGCRALVITGSGPKFFSAGADITGFGAGADAIGKATDLTLLFEASRLGVIAAVNGIAFGGGCELTLACDVRLAARTARFAQPEIKLGIIPGWGGTQRLPRLIGAARATELLLTGDPIDAERALAIGLVAEVVDPDELPAAARRWAELLASRAPLALAATKRAMRAGAQLPIADALKEERSEFVALFSTEDAQEGIAAFLQKRPPKWKGR
jgi:enoyl-CoA hydratase/carnithine racemase